VLLYAPHLCIPQRSHPELPKRPWTHLELSVVRALNSRALERKQGSNGEVIDVHIHIGVQIVVVVLRGVGAVNFPQI